MLRLGLVLLVAFALALAVGFGVPAAAAHTFGPPATGLTAVQVLRYSARLLWDDGLLGKPLLPGAPAIRFRVEPGESVASISSRLQSQGVIMDAAVMRDYLAYTGLDMGIQSGVYDVGPGMSIIDVARTMQDATPSEITLVILPGWRLEEIAGSLPTSGLEITPEAFLAAASAPPAGYEFLPGAGTAEGFLFPDAYILPRSTNANQLIEALIRNFAQHLRIDIQEGIRRQGLSVYQAVILASIVQRESMQPAEAPLIASVYLNRMRTGMRLDADPTVQYALGFNAAQGTWWTNPLSLSDLQQVSAYNTYVNDGLPPTPIDNPGLAALEAVSAPAETPYYYFSARCDGSGYHNFAQTFEEHLRNICP